MMIRRGAMALLLLCIGAAALIESVHARSHADFSRSTYYEPSDTVTTIVPPKDGEPATTEPTERYPHGHYPGQKHVWNATTEKYESVNATEDAQPEGRYPHGHYPGQTHVWNPTTEKYDAVNATTRDVPDGRYPHGHYPGQSHIWNATTEKYETVNGTTEAMPEGRYPHGHYPGQSHVWNATTEQYNAVEPTENITTQVPKNRYEHGYYGKAVFNYSEGDTLEVIKSPETSSFTKASEEKDPGTQDRYPAGYHNGHGSNPAAYKQYSSSSETEVESTTFDPVEGRYKNGYHPKSTYAGNSQKSTTPNYSAKDPASTNGERYPFGYHSESKPVRYSGGFSTLPFPSSGVPYVATGAGCRSAYWADHPASWPSFLSVKSTVVDAFGEQAAAEYGQTTILEALLKYGSDPFSEVVRSGCTALLNSYTRGEFPIPYIKVIAEFNAALVSKEAAAKQALVFETANVESISAGNACS